MTENNQNHETGVSKNFYITDGKGFQITFSNGNTVSVQWGPTNYCDNHRRISKDKTGVFCDNAEVWAWNNAGVQLFNPQGYQTPSQVAQLIYEVSKM